MTSEVVLMNRQAVAMAADSAVTISGQDWIKTYQSVDKLFPLVDGHPVAIMIYNNAEIMSTPWETVISLYRDAMRGQALDTVQDYAEDFMNFLSGNPDLFPPDHQDTEYFKMVAVVFSAVAEDFEMQVRRLQETGGGRVREHLSSIFEYVVGQLHEDYKRYPDDSARGDLECFPKGMDEQVRRRYGGDVEHLIDSLLSAIRNEHGAIQVSDETRNRLRDIAVFVATRDAFFEHYTGVVFAGFGAREKYPAMRSYLSSGVVLGILKRKNDRTVDMTADGGPVVQPFAQDRMIKTFLTGMDEYQRRFIFGETLKLSVNIASEVIGSTPNLSDTQRETLLRNYSETNMRVALGEFFRSIDGYQYAVHTRPIYRAIASLPRRELGETAASLIKLNSFQQKVMHAIETVGGPIDVAVITRSSGLELKRDKPDL